MTRTTTHEPPVVSLVLPCRDQADHIGDLLPRYAAALGSLGLPFELVVVPNASADATEAVVRAAAAGDDRVRVAVNPSGGWGLSVRTGLAAARGSVLAYTNTARTDPSTVPGFVRLHLERGHCLVKARRAARRAPAREIGSLLYNLEARAVFGLRCGDVNGTPKVFSRALYASARLSEPGDLLDLELMVRAQRAGVPVVEVPVRGFRRHGGRSGTTLRSAWRMYRGALRLRRDLSG
jgi:glycosyltransferase involved in cell wall biosynthesis